MMFEKKIESLLINKKLAVLGFGREGTSTFQLIRRLFPEKHIAVFDSNENIAQNAMLKDDSNVTLYTGENYLRSINNFDFVIKSPGVSFKEFYEISFCGKISSQTDIFLSCFASQVIGVTGTKGKSTTSSLLMHILKTSGHDVVFVGNIGIPPFDEIDKIGEKTYIVYEMSSHQLESVNHSPHIAILLNIFQEHLDHYNSYEKYQEAKVNIGKYQKVDDFFIFNADNLVVVSNISKLKINSTLLPFTSVEKLSEGCFCDDKEIEINIKGYKKVSYKTDFKRNLIGQHNLMNIAIAMMVSKIIGIEDVSVFDAIATFRGLPHRLEYVGCFKNKHFYNDSIATIPEAAIEAIKTLRNIDALIAGGYDRGIDYKSFANFLSQASIRTVILIGDAGKRIYDLLSVGEHNKNIFYYSDFDEAIKKAITVTQEDTICLLSPAAASYGMFKNFEERGERFKELLSLYA